AVFSLSLLLVTKLRQNETILGIAAVAVFASLWIDKGMGMIVAGFTPNPTHVVVPYTPTLIESLITLAIWGMGALIVTILYKVALTLRKQVQRVPYRA
ncbi:menaquinol oxidoreductase, partial [bacterium]|nr:menaquinol oxidoreductase [bacterium]